MAPPSKKKIDDAIKALNSVRRDWLRRPGCTGVDVGFKIKGTKLTDEVALRFHVQRKKPLEALETHELPAPKNEKIQGFDVDVLEVEYGVSDVAVPSPPVAVEAVDRRSRVDPLVGGVSCGNPRITAGTLGAIVFDRATGDPCILSNWHVLAGDQAATVGEPIWQPGRADGGDASDVVATMLRVRRDPDLDAGLARLNGARPWSRDILELDPLRGVEEPVLGMQVRKSGRTTGLTEGIVDGVSFSTRIGYSDGVVQAFRDQIHIIPRPPWPDVDVEISMGGDSGSVWVNEANGNAVGLHFAGESTASPTDEHAIANRMPVVARELNFSVTPLFRLAHPLDGRLRGQLRDILFRHWRDLGLRLPRPLPDPEDLVQPGTLPDARDPAELERLVDEIIAAVASSR